MRNALPSDLAVALKNASGRLGPFAKRVLYLSETPSTNDVAARLAIDGAPEGTMVVADAQTSGRGSAGRSWFSPKGAGLYVSVLLRSSRISHLTLMGGVAVAEGIRSSTGLSVMVKWPNDVVVEDFAAPRINQRRRKVAGILSEASGVGANLEYVILGFGINLRPATFPRELDRTATSVEAELGRPVDRAIVLVETLASLATWYIDLLAGRTHTILVRCRELSPSSLGSEVELLDRDRRWRGVTEGIDDDGALLVRVGTHVKRIISGEIRWL